MPKNLRPPYRRRTESEWKPSKARLDGKTPRELPLPAGEAGPEQGIAIAGYAKSLREQAQKMLQAADFLEGLGRKLG